MTGMDGADSRILRAREAPAPRDVCEALTRRDVLDALLPLSRGRVPEASKLSRLDSVRLSLEAAGFRATPQALELELGRVLLDTTESELRRLRGLAGVTSGPATGVGRPRGVPHRAPDETPETIRASIQADFRPGHHGLEAISAVYHLYLRPDLGLSLDDFVRVLGDRHRRTIQRRLRLGTSILTRRLLELERAARREGGWGEPRAIGATG